MDAALTKLFITGIVAVGYWYSLTPPSYPSNKDKLYLDGVFGYIAYNLPILSKLAVVASLLCQTITITAVEYPSLFHTSHSLLYVCHSNNPQKIVSLSSQFLIGSAIVVLMTVVRGWCYHTLGTLFTFQITIRHDHRLITTGPYGYVRHPAYGALVAIIIGVNIVLMDRQGWAMQCDMLSTSLRWWIYTFFVLCAFSITSMIKRGKIEDERLKEEFKDEWLSYSKKVPYGYVPGIF